jgi:hypothetical protein
LVSIVCNGDVRTERVQGARQISVVVSDISPSGGNGAADEHRSYSGRGERTLAFSILTSIIDVPGSIGARNVNTIGRRNTSLG